MKRLFSLWIASMLSACALSPPQADNMLAKQIETSHFTMSVWEKGDIQKGAPLRIYFEGDGNPNPVHTIAFEFAKKDTAQNVIYIARPCQWSEDKICTKKTEIYQSARFNPEIIAEMHELAQYLVRKYQAPSVELVGYDGGAVIALNLATKLPTSRVITIAGITDINAFNELHDLPLMSEDEAENPADNLVLLAEIPQVHYVGKEDTVTPRRLVERFVSRMKNPKSAVVKVVPDTKHTDWKGVKLDY